MHSPIGRIKKILSGLEKYASDLAKDYDLDSLSGPQGKIIYFLSENEDKTIFIKDIEKHFNISKSGASKLIQRMNKNGFVEILSKENDKRYKKIILTPLARSKIPALTSFHDELISTAFKGISTEDFIKCENTFETIAKNLNMKEDKNV